MDRREARQRKVPEGLGLLGFAARDELGMLRLGAELLDLWRPRKELIVVRAWNPFAGLDQVEAVQPGQFTIHPELGAVTSTTGAGAMQALSAWPAEVYVIFFSDVATLAAIRSAETHEPRFVRESASGTCEQHYLGFLDRVDPFLFIAEGHAGIELIGRGSTLLLFLDTFRAKFPPPA